MSNYNTTCTSSTGNEVCVRIISEDNCTFIIHGTFANKPECTWWRKEGSFARAVDEIHPCVWRALGSNSCTYDIDIFSWSGENKHADRVEGGSRLAQKIVETENQKNKNEIAYKNINIVAHSHGGNVVLEALKELYYKKITVNDVILIATPHVQIRYKTLGDGLLDKTFHRFLWLYYDPIVFNVISGNFYNIFSPEDSVQTFWADMRDGISSDDVPRYDGFIFDEIIMHREIRSKLINLRQDTDVGGQDAHGVLHSTPMGSAIGYLFEGKKWIASRELAGIPPIITDENDKGD